MLKVKTAATASQTGPLDLDVLIMSRAVILVT